MGGTRALHVVLIGFLLLFGWAMSARGATLGITADGGFFAIDGVPTYLNGISYYGAQSISTASFVTQDLDDMVADGFNWMRVWGFWATPSGLDVSIMTHDGQVREPYMTRLETLITECNSRGIIVDVSLTRDAGRDWVGPWNQTEHLACVQTLSQRLLPYRNVYIDISNERDIGDDRYVSLSECGQLIDAIKAIDPDRLCTASSVPGSQSQLADFKNVAHMDFITPHLCRHDGCSAQTIGTVEDYLEWMSNLGWRIPVHLQEPFRRGYTTYNPVEDDFLRDCNGGKLAGAAGWCLHNGSDSGARPYRCFDMSDAEGRIYTQWDSVEVSVTNALSGHIAGNDLNVLRYQPEYGEQLAKQVGRREGSTRSANVAQDAAGYLTYGPYVTRLAAGSYQATWRMAIDDVTADNDPVVTIDVYTIDTNSVLATRTITRQEFDQPNIFQDFTISFDYGSPGNRLEWRTLFLDRCYLKLDYVEITAQPAPAPVFEDALRNADQISGQYGGGGFSSAGYTLSHSGGTAANGEPQSRDFVYYNLDGVGQDGTGSIEFDVTGLAENDGVNKNHLLTVADRDGCCDGGVNPCDPATNGWAVYGSDYFSYLRKINYQEPSYDNKMKLTAGALCQVTEEFTPTAYAWDGATTYRFRMCWNGNRVRYYRGLPGQMLTLLADYTMAGGTWAPDKLHIQVGASSIAQITDDIGGTPGTVYSLLRVYEEDLGATATPISQTAPTPVFEDDLSDASEISGQYGSGVFSADGYTLTHSGGYDEFNTTEPRSIDFVWYDRPGTWTMGSIEFDVTGLAPSAGCTKNELMVACDSTGLNPAGTAGDFYTSPYQALARKSYDDTYGNTDKMKMTVKGSGATLEERSNVLGWNAATTYRFRMTWNGSQVRWWRGLPGQTLTEIEPPSPQVVGAWSPQQLHVQLGATFRAGPRGVQESGGQPGTRYSLLRLYQQDLGGTATPPRGGQTNTAPQVDAGPSQVIHIPAAANLAGVVTDDGLPNPPGAVTVKWSKIGGPGTVVFGNPNAVNTTATFSESGEYVLRLTAGDSQLFSYDDVTITVHPTAADLDLDGDVDQSDFGLMQICFSGDGYSHPGGCDDADFDDDGDVDHLDLGTLESCLAGPNQPPNC